MSNLSRYLNEDLHSGLEIEDVPGIVVVDRIERSGLAVLVSERGGPFEYLQYSGSKSKGLTYSEAIEMIDNVDIFRYDPKSYLIFSGELSGIEGKKNDISKIKSHLEKKIQKTYHISEHTSE